MRKALSQFYGGPLWLAGVLFYGLSTTVDAGITKTGNAFTDTNGWTYVGTSGNGSIKIDADSDYAVPGAIVLGFSSSDVGTIDIEGVGSSMTTTQSVYLGYYGAGVLNIKAGGRLISNGPAFSYGITLGYGSGGSGTVTVDGDGSQWYITEMNMALGTVAGSSGSLKIQNGGDVTFLKGSLNLAVGSSLLVTGKDPLTGRASTLNILNANGTAQFHIGGPWTPTATVSAGGIINSAGSNKVGTQQASGVPGKMTVTGEGSQWNVVGSLIVGDLGGKGIVRVEDGGLISVSAAGSTSGTGDGIMMLGGPPSASGTGASASEGNLYIGNGGAAGRLNLREITGYVRPTTGPYYVSANSTVTFLHNESAHAFANTAGDGIVISGSTRVSHESGTTLFTAASTYSGGTEIRGGKLIVNNTSGSGTGTGTVTVFTTGAIGGSGTIGGDTTIAGVLEPGNSPGTLTFDQDLTLESTARTIMELGSGTSSDKIVVRGFLIYGGTLQIDLLDGFEPSDGWSFDLFDFQGTGYGGMFDSIIFTNPAYSGTLNYDTGVLTLAAPEPGVGASLVLGGMALVLNRRRKAPLAELSNRLRGKRSKG